MSKAEFHRNLTVASPPQFLGDGATGSWDRWMRWSYHDLARWNGAG